MCDLEIAKNLLSRLKSNLTNLEYGYNCEDAVNNFIEAISGPISELNQGRIMLAYNSFTNNYEHSWKESFVLAEIDTLTEILCPPIKVESNNV